METRINKKCGSGRWKKSNPWQQSNHDNQFEPSIKQCHHYVSVWCIRCLSIPYNKKDMTPKTVNFMKM